MKKVGIMGGTFDPPHHGHLLIANEVLSSLELDEIWFMPTGEPPHKKKSQFISNGDRLRMLEIAVNGNEYFKVEPIEFNRTGPSFTIDTVKLLKDIHHDCDFFFIIGADMIEYLPKWHKIDELITLVQFVGVERMSYNHNSNYPILYVDVPVMEVSSSQIRERLENGRTVQYLVPDKVIDYIKENGLYGS